MTERSYTVSEIEALRQAVETKWLFGSYQPQRVAGECYASRQYRGGEKEQAVEAIVRTHMLAGHTAKDLYDSEKSAFQP